MKRIIIYFSVIIALLVGAICLVFYNPKVEYNEDIKRYVCVMNEGGSYWTEVLAGIEEADKEMGTYTKKISFPRFDVEEQINQLDKIDYLQVDGVITVGEPFSEKLNQKIESIVERGIPVVLIDTDSDKSKRTCYIGSNNYQVGLMAAQKMEQITGGNAQILVLVSELMSANQQERYNGFYEGIMKYAGMQIVTVQECKADKATAIKNIKSTLEQHGSINAVFCAESSSSSPIGSLLESEYDKYKDIKVIGFDAAKSTLRYVEEGLFQCTIKQNAFKIGQEAVSYLNNYKENQEESKREIYIDVEFITKSDEN